MKGFPEGDPRASEAGKRGGTVSGEARQAKRAKYWQARGIDPVLAEQIRLEGYQAGYATGRKERVTR